ncbi:hypothetical protein D3C81_1920830 [compost metagenome]
MERAGFDFKEYRRIAVTNKSLTEEYQLNPGLILELQINDLAVFTVIDALPDQRFCCQRFGR